VESRLKIMMIITIVITGLEHKIRLSGKGTSGEGEERGKREDAEVERG
jgi:hypothetical protein